jgi:aryl-alcohol dehydrogenase-like predicted oxidoreductase
MSSGWGVSFSPHQNRPADQRYHRLMNTRKLGTATVFPIGLGCMGMSGMYGQTDDNESIRTIHAAIDRGITLFDTGDFYGMGHNELLIGQALKQLSPAVRDTLTLSVKFGAMRTPNGAWGGFDGRPGAVKNFLAYSLNRLGVSQIGIYRPARLDDKIQIEDTIGAVADMIRQGFVKQAALSEVSVETARRAQAITPITDIQLEYGLSTRGMEEKVFPGLRELGIGTTAYGVIGRGLLSGSKPQEKGDFRRFLPRFTGANLIKNQTLIAALNEVAAELGATPVQAAIAWVMTRGEDIVPILGARTVAQLEESFGALEIKLTEEQLALLEQAVPASEVAGTRYDKQAMTHLDSER